MISVQNPPRDGFLEKTFNLKKNKDNYNIKNFRVIECIGRGNFGDVYKAFDLIKKKNVAIKAINLEQSEDEIPVLLQEINLLRSLKHPNITNWYSTFIIDVSMFIVMEYCSEGSCADLLKFNKNGLSDVPLAYIMKSVLEGLSYLHSENIIHRDIKAANILINGEGIIKLADFGVSGQMNSGSGRRTFVGTPYWMAPEIVIDKEKLKIDRENLERRLNIYGLGKHTLYKIWKKKISIEESEVKKEDKESKPTTSNSEMDDVEYDEKVDIWSLGITLIELSTGKVPNNEKEPLKALFDIPKKEPPFVSKNSSYYLKEFCLACLSKDPTMRLSATELLRMKFITKNKPRIGELDILVCHGSKIHRKKPKFELNFNTLHYGPNVDWKLQKTIREGKKENWEQELRSHSSEPEMVENRNRNSNRNSNSSSEEELSDTVELQSESTGAEMFSNNLLPPNEEFRRTAETSPVHGEQGDQAGDQVADQVRDEGCSQGGSAAGVTCLSLDARVERALQRAWRCTGVAGTKATGKRPVHVTRAADPAHVTRATDATTGLKLFSEACAALSRCARAEPGLFLALARALSSEFAGAEELRG